MDCTRIISCYVYHGRHHESLEALAESLPWVTEVSSGLVRFIGISELLGGLGLLLPYIFRLKPFLTVWAALGLAAVMVLAAVSCVKR